MSGKAIKANSNSLFGEHLNKYDYKFSKGDLVKGTVVGIDNSGVLVDIGAKAVAFVHPKEVFCEEGQNFKNALELNHEYEFLITREEDEDGQFLLSHKKVAQAYSWKKLEEVFAANESITAEVKSIVRGGITVEVFGLKAFVPSSQLRLKDIDNSVGEKLELKILSMDAATQNLIFSQRKL